MPHMPHITQPHTVCACTPLMSRALAGERGQCVHARVRAYVQIDVSVSSACVRVCPALPPPRLTPHMLAPTPHHLTSPHPPPLERPILLSDAH
eukprot:1928089-Rhodomonas_salina.1